MKELDLSGTKATAAGRAALQKALPQCRVQFEPAAKAAKPQQD